MTNKLRTVADLSKSRISLDEIDIYTYVSTDNLLQNKQGKVTAEKMPKQNSNSVTRFDEGDILVANIRPYLKKIWLAKYTGGSSSDVLTFKVKKNYISSFVYYSLFREEFFQHMMNGSKGTKMPRGDKIQILDFPIPDFDISTQKKIAKVLSDLDAKIEVNNKINVELEAMAKLIYDYWFVQFDFPNENGKPYKSSGGEMVYNEELKREIPEGWEIVELKHCLKLNRGVSYSSKDINGEGIPMINLNSFNTDSTYKPDGIKSFSGIYNDSKVLKPLDLVMCNTQQTAINTKTDIIGKSFLIPDIFEREIVSSHHVTTIKVEKDNLKYYLNTLFNTEYFHRYISGYATGTNILGLDFSGVLSYKAEIPNDELLNKYKSIAVNVEKQKSIAIKENQKLSELRDWLLPLLMNGQVTVKSEKRNELHELFPSVNLYAEVAALQLIDRRMNKYSHGKTFIQKSMSHLKDIKQEERLKNVDFEEYYWGMFSKTIAQSIDGNPYLAKEKTSNGKSVYNVKPSKIKELSEWMSMPENQSFVKSIENLISIYQEPLIDNNIDRIELLNTVYRCMAKLETTDLNKIRHGMRNWPMQDGNHKNKAEKFTPNETMHMIQFIKTKLA